MKRKRTEKQKESHARNSLLWQLGAAEGLLRKIIETPNQLQGAEKVWLQTARDSVRYASRKFKERTAP